jgi:hypothetical protein
MKAQFLPLLLIVLSACQSNQMVRFSPLRSGETISARKSPVAGSEPVGTAAQHRQPESVKVYGINRYTDAADSRIMHERHAVYRLEQQPSWVTRPARTTNEIILGPIVGLRKPEYAPEPLPGETAREILQARRGIEQANEGMKSLQESQERLTSNVESLAKNTAEAERKLTAVVSVLNEHVKRLEGDTPVSGEQQPQVKTTIRDESEINVRAPDR